MLRQSLTSVGRLIGSRRPSAAWMLTLGIVALSVNQLLAQSGAATARPVAGLMFAEKAPGIVVITQVDEAAKLPLRAGDVIVSVNGTPVTNAAEVERILKTLRGGEKATLVVIRGEKEATIQVAAPQVGAVDTTVGFFGATLRLDGQKRVMVSEVTARGAAEAAGLRPGDVIISIDGQTATSVDTLVKQATKAVDAMKPGDPLAVVIERDGQIQDLALVLSASPVIERQPRDTDEIPVPMNTMVLGVVVREESNRVVVTQVMDAGPAAVAEMLHGDVILGLNGQKTESFAALTGALNGFRPAQKVKVDVLRGNDVISLFTVAIRNKTAVPDVALDPNSSLQDRPLDLLPGNSTDDHMLTLQQRVDRLEAAVQELSRQVAALRGR